MVLYKYCKREFVPERGGCNSIRIGTLGDYRNTAKYGELTGDALDGSAMINGVVEAVDTAAHAQSIASALVRIEPGSTVGRLSISNAVISSADRYVFSCAASYSEAAHAAWKKAEGYDACYQILYPVAFFRWISRVIADRASCFDLGPVQYVQSYHPSSKKIDAAFVKRQTRYFGQDEMRAIWTPSVAGSLSPFTVVVPDIDRLCALYRVI